VGHARGFHLVRKAAFDGEIENREEDDVVVAEGSIRARRKNGGVLNAVFCDVFAMRDAKIRRLTTYLAELK
jgi:ketosteroid isomerase-like protein